jgi:hypothetical protein
VNWFHGDPFSEPPAILIDPAHWEEFLGGGHWIG